MTDQLSQLIDEAFGGPEPKGARQVASGHYYDPNEIVRGESALPGDVIVRGRLDMNEEVVGPNGAFGARGEVFGNERPAAVAADDDDVFRAFAALEGGDEESEGSDWDLDPGGEFAEIDQLPIGDDGGVYDALLTHEPVNGAPAGKELQTDASPLERAITLLKKHHVPQDVLEGLSGEQILQWEANLAPVYNENRDIRRQLAELRKSDQSAQPQQQPASGDALAGTPAAVNLDDLEKTLQEEIGEAAGGKLLAAFRSVMQQNQELQSRINGVSSQTAAQLVDGQLDGLSGSYAQIASNAPGSAEARSRVARRAAELVQSGRQYQSHAEVFREAALLELGQPVQAGQANGNASAYRQRNLGQPTAGGRRSSALNTDRMTPEQRTYLEFRQMESRKQAL